MPYPPAELPSNREFVTLSTLLLPDVIIAPPPPRLLEIKLPINSLSEIFAVPADQNAPELMPPVLLLNEQFEIFALDFSLII